MPPSALFAFRLYQMNPKLRDILASHALIEWFLPSSCCSQLANSTGVVLNVWTPVNLGIATSSLPRQSSPILCSVLLSVLCPLHLCWSLFKLSTWSLVGARLDWSGVEVFALGTEGETVGLVRSICRLGRFRGGASCPWFFWGLRCHQDNYLD